MRDLATEIRNEADEKGEFILVALRKAKSKPKTSTSGSSNPCSNKHALVKNSVENNQANQWS